MSLSGHHLLASSQWAGSPKSPAPAAAGFNCLCINAIPLVPSDTSNLPLQDEHLNSAPVNGMPDRTSNDLASASGRRPSLQFSGPDTNAMLDSEHFISRTQSSRSLSSSQPDVLAPVFEKFSAEIGRPSIELSNQWDRKIPPRKSAELHALDGRSMRTVDEKPKPKPKPRRVFINDPSRTNDDGDMAGNKVRTSKYTLLTFLPKNLFEQFRRVAYIYFLAIVILNQIPQLAVFGRTASLFPLLFVLVVTAIKDGYEDWGRHKSDIIENNRLANVLFHGGFQPKKWKRIQVGEVVRIEADTPVPCDMVLLGTSDPNGVAYIQTLNLDGESNLKTRYACQDTQVKTADINTLHGCVVCDQPTRNIYEFSATLELDGQHISLGPKNVILRGCELKNTSWVIGVVVYAGKDTKVMMNSAGVRSKRSKLESQMNTATMWLAFFLLIICLVGGVGMGLWVSRHSGMLSSLAYYHKKDASTGEDVAFYNVFGEAVFAFLSFVIMFQVMIPISLYISMELVRLGQSSFMSRDDEMYYDDLETRFECRALNINEDLGQVKYVFSDKTGTLTQNKMMFYAATIDGVNYNDGAADYDVIQSCPEHQVEKGDRLKSEQPVKVSPRLLKLLQTNEQTPCKKALQEFFLVLAICNTVVPIRVDDESQICNASSMKRRVPSIEYQAESPDEQALVSAAASYGFILLERSTNHVRVDVQGKPQRYEILGVHEFDSVRKRMSVIVRCPDGSIKLLLKGADVTVLSLVSKCSLSRDNSALESYIEKVYTSTLEHLKEYAELGLRTLLIASRELSEVEFHEWKTSFTDATARFLGSDRMSMLQKVAEIIERNVLLLGATGVEDKLQDGVPETIAALRDAGMKVWVLTGDKQETAVSIGFSCNLLTREMEMITISTSTERDCTNAISDALERQRISSQQNSSLTWALIIDGNSLVHALMKDLEQKLFDLATSCQVVICCRVAPSQKANIVSLIKDKTREMTLAIGDGANDVPMLQKAHVGIGLSGQEGRQAVMSSDFSMGQFRFLKKLLLVHGHWNYQRLSYMILYNFYRNSVFVMMLFWYILQTAFSASSAIFDWNLMFYSLIYTSVPTIVVGIFDKDISQRSLLEYPPLYGAGQRDENYNSLLFWVTMLDTLWQSLVLFYVPLYTFENSTIDIWSIGSLWTIAVVILVNLHLALDVQRWTWITHLAIWGSIVSTFGCLFILDAIKLDSFLPHYWVIFEIVQTFSYWYDIVLIVVLALLPRFLVKVVVQRVWPSDVQIIREVEAKRNL